MLKSEVDISVVVPVHKTGAALHDLDKEIAASLEGHSFEVIYVSDGFDPPTWNTLKSIKKEHADRTKIILLDRNYGQNAATLCGLDNGRGQWLFTLDDDGQTPPDAMPGMLATAQEQELQVVFGQAKQPRQSWIRRVGSSTIKRLFQRVDGSDIGSSFRLITSDMRDQLCQQHHRHLFINQVLNWYTTAIGIVSVSMRYRTTGRSGYTLSNLIGISFRLLIYYTDLPLRLMSLGGLFISIACFVLGSYLGWQHLMQDAPLGSKAVIVALFFATGLLMICLSVLGMYVNRIYKNGIQRPAYTIRELH